MAAVDITSVPYKGSGPSIVDIVGGQVQMMMTGVVALMPHVKTGRLRVLAVSSSVRIPAMPDLATIARSGVPKFDVSSWFGLFLPVGTPHPIVNQLHAQVSTLT